MGTLDVVVNTLLQIGCRIVEVSDECIVTNLWERTGIFPSWPLSQYKGKRLADLPLDTAE